MKAAAIHQNGGPEVLQYEDVPDPVCADDGVVIEVETVSIEGGDLLARLMTPPAGPSHVVGYIAAGTVREIGANVKDEEVVKDRNWITSRKPEDLKAFSAAAVQALR